MPQPIATVEQIQDRVIAHVNVAEVLTDGLRELTLEMRLRLQDGARTFVFGFDKVEFLPSACLALLLMFYQDAKHHDARIVLLNCQENVSLLLRLARLDVLFELVQGQAHEA